MPDEPQERLVPPGNLAAEDFVLSSPKGLLAKPSGQKTLQPRALALARLCVEVYKEAKRLEREEKMLSADAEERKAWTEFGRHFVVVSPVEVVPVGSDGTWMVNLRTTHLNTATHPGIVRTTFIFNENVTDLSKPSRSLKFDWVVAERTGNYVIAGNREKLGGLTERQLQEKLKRDSYTNVGVISIAEEDRRMGFMVK